ncbi:unnamed protein product, partial [Rotaria magnacalcarata]
TVDRTNTDAKLLPCLIGKLENIYSVENRVDLKRIYPVELKQLVVDNLKDITFIEACKFYVRASTSGRTCDCKGKCASKQCPCKKDEVFCSTKCHSKRDCCKTVGEQIITLKF